MRIALFSDIHGNITGLKAVLQHIDEQGGADVFVSAGDMIGGGAGAEDLLDLLVEREVQMIQGDWEELTMGLNKNIHRIGDSMKGFIRKTHDWLHANMAQSYWDLLEQLPKTKTINLHSNGELFVCHASPDNAWEKSCSADISAKLLTEVYGHIDSDIIAYGHYHHHHVMRLDQKHLINVASVGLRYDGLANWTLIESKRNQLVIKQFQVPYDVVKERRLKLDRKVPSYE